MLYDYNIAIIFFWAIKVFASELNPSRHVSKAEMHTDIRVSITQLAFIT